MCRFTSRKTYCHISFREAVCAGLPGPPGAAGVEKVVLWPNFSSRELTGLVQGTPVHPLPGHHACFILVSL